MSQYNSPHQPRISVLLPIHNGEEYVRESIVSILSQDIDDFELIVCDDGSTDSTRSILESCKDSRCRLLINKEKRGLFVSLNRLMPEARAPLVHLFSHDDRMLPNCLERTCDFASRHPDVGLIYSEMHFIDSKGHRAPETGRIDNTPPVVSPLLAAQIMFYFGSIAGNIANVTLRKAAFENVGRFREDLLLSGDYEYWTRLSERYPIGFQRERLIELRVHDNQFSKQRSSALRYLKENTEVYDRLFARLPAAEIERARHFRRWVIDVNTFHQAVLIAKNAHPRAALEAFRLVRQTGRVLPLAFRWLISQNGRRVERPEL